MADDGDGCSWSCFSTSMDIVVGLGYMILSSIEIYIGASGCGADNLEVYLVVAGVGNILFILFAFMQFCEDAQQCSKWLMGVLCLLMFGWWIYGSVHLVPHLKDSSTEPSHITTAIPSHEDNCSPGTVIGVATIEWGNKLSLPILKLGNSIVKKMSPVRQNEYRDVP